MRCQVGEIFTFLSQMYPQQTRKNRQGLAPLGHRELSFPYITNIASFDLFLFFEVSLLFLRENVKKYMLTTFT